MIDLDIFIEKLKQFSEERGWNPYHIPKDLLIKLMEEVGEVAEQFGWQSNEEILESLKDDRRKQAIGDELIDVLIVLLTLMNAVDLDIEVAFNRKIKKNALKYPVGQDIKKVKKI